VGPTSDLPITASHLFYRRLNQLLGEHGFESLLKRSAGLLCRDDGAPESAADDLLPTAADRLLRRHRFGALDRLRAADSLACDFLALALTEAPPDHSTISRTRRLIAVEARRAVFRWVVQCLRRVGLIKGKTIGLDATTLEANAALRPACCSQPRRIAQSWTAGRD
jgi:transposase